MPQAFLYLQLYLHLSLSFQLCPIHLQNIVFVKILQMHLLIVDLFVFDICHPVVFSLPVFWPPFKNAALCRLQVKKK